MKKKQEPPWERIKPSGIDKLWNETIGEYYPPDPSLLKWNFFDRWIRFHSLPKSKRVPKNRKEERIILQRHNEILQSIFRANDPLYVVRTAWSSEAEKPTKRDDLGEHWRSWVDLSDGVTYTLCHSYFKEVEWKLGVFDELILSVAKDIENQVMVINQRNHHVYHPYDGGCDLILKSRRSIPKLRTLFKEYLSPHPYGL